MHGNSVLSIIETLDERELDSIWSSVGESPKLEKILSSLLVGGYFTSYLARSWVVSMAVGLTAEH